MSAAAIFVDEHSIHLCPEWSITRIHIIRAKRVSNSHLRYTAIQGYIQKNKTVTVVVITGGWSVAKKQRNIRTPSDSQYKQGLDKMRCNSGLSNSFSERFFYWFCRARAQSAEPVSFSSHIKKVRSTPAQVARLHHPNFGAPVKRVPICWRDMSGACLLYTSPSPRDKRQSRMPSSA